MEVQSLSGDSLAVTTAGGAKSVPLGNVLALSREVKQQGGATTRPAGFVLTLQTGDRLTGTPQAIEGETLTWASAAVGELKVSLRDVRSLSKGVAAMPQSDQPPAEDTLTLGNGDVVKGIVAGFAEGRLSVLQGGETLPVPLESVATVLFASPAKPAAGGTPGRAFRVSLSDGSTLTGPAVEIAQDKATLKLADGTRRSVPLASVASVEQLNGPVMFLSSLTPAEDVQRPYLGEPWPSRFDQSVTGQPLPGGARGIGVHAYSRLTFNVDSSHRTFRTQYAIDGSGPLANVTVRVLLDGKAAYERANVTAAAGASEVVTVPLAGAKTLTLEVDYGASNDTQDRFAWIEPALLKAEAGTAATQPGR